jgi:hypothetical protein
MVTRRRKRSRRPSPAVLVTVAGGVAYACASQDIRVVIVDWDNLGAPDSLQAYSINDIQAVIDEIETLPRGILKRASETLVDLRREIDRREQLKRFGTRRTDMGGHR